MQVGAPRGTQIKRNTSLVQKYNFNTHLFSLLGKITKCVDHTLVLYRSSRTFQCLLFPSLVSKTQTMRNTQWDKTKTMIQLGIKYGIMRDHVRCFLSQLRSMSLASSVSWVTHSTLAYHGKYP